MAKGNIDGYTLTDKMRKTRRRLPLTSTEQALYHELVAICNEDGWVDVFPCSNEELCTALRITENTLEKARLTLIGGGLVHYRSGKSKRQFGQYSFVKNITTSTTTSKFEVNNGVNAATNKGTNMGVNAEVNNGVNAADYNTETKTETKSKTKTSKSHSGEAPAKEKKDLLFWKSFIEVWNTWYKNNVGDNYCFLGKDFAHLKRIYKFLEKRAEERKMEFTEENLIAAFNFFLDKAWKKDEWLKRNFSIANVLSQFNQIANNAKSTNQTGKQPTGAAVNTGSILSRINSMPD